MNEDDYRELDPVDAEIARLVEVGALTPKGVSADGELMYGMDAEILQREAPSLYEAHLADIEEELLSLYEKGLVNIEFNDDMEALYSLADGVDIDNLGDVE